MPETSPNLNTYINVKVFFYIKHKHKKFIQDAKLST